MIKTKIRLIQKFKEMERKALNLKELDATYLTPYKKYPELIRGLGEGYKYNTKYTVVNGIVTGVSYKFDENVSTFPTSKTDIYTSIEYDNYSYAGADTTYLNNDGVDFLIINNESLSIRTSAGETFQNVQYFKAPKLVEIVGGGASAYILRNAVNIEIPKLERVARGNFFINYQGLELTFPELKTVTGATFANDSIIIKKFVANNASNIGNIANNANSNLETVECKSITELPQNWLNKCTKLKDVWVGVINTFSRTYPPLTNVDKSIFKIHIKNGSNQLVIDWFINKGYNVEVY